MSSKIKFNKRGHLSKTQFISFQDFEDNFVKDNFYKRPLIFEEFKEYLTELPGILQQDTIDIWVNGSFVTDEIEPKDIDFLVFVDKNIQGFSNVITEYTKRFRYVDVYFILKDDKQKVFEEWINYWIYSFSHSANGLHRKGFLN
ncbi:MAG: hypothetical protein LRY55_13450 [Leadbetterella sp.]|nr:hypothetical protein [Leadbetterella sp.]